MGEYDGAMGAELSKWMDGLEKYILVEQSTRVWAQLKNSAGGHVHIIQDNTGRELMADLALIAYLLSTGLAGTVTLHLKLHPTFIGDTTMPDYNQAVEALTLPRALDPMLLGEDAHMVDLA